MTIGVVTTEYHDIDLPEGYSWLEVGCALRNSHISGVLYDNVGENISDQNDSYCELTGLYWLWRNCEDEIRGLCHYRRLYSGDRKVRLLPSHMRSARQIPEELLTQAQAEELLRTHDLILLMPYDPGDVTAREDLGRYVSAHDIDVLDQIIREKWPDWQTSYEMVMASRNLSYCNMLIAGREVYDDYCQFLFTILGQYAERIDLTGYTVQQRRIYGYIAEVLLNVYVRQRELRPAYVNMLSVMECYGKTPSDRCIYRVYSWIERIMSIPAVRVLYRVYARIRYPERYQSLMVLQEQMDHD